MKHIKKDFLQLTCTVCGKEVQGSTESEVIHNFRVHKITHEKDDKKPTK